MEVTGCALERIRVSYLCRQLWFLCRKQARAIENSSGRISTPLSPTYSDLWRGTQQSPLNPFVTSMLLGDKMLGCISKENDYIFKHKGLKTSLCWERNRHCRGLSHNAHLVHHTLVCGSRVLLAVGHMTHEDAAVTPVAPLPWEPRCLSCNHDGR